MRGHVKALLCVVLAGAGSVACASVRTQHDYDPNADFSRWRTYAWYPATSSPTGDPRLDNPLLHERIVAAVAQNLVSQGFATEQDETPDFYVNYHLSLQQRLDVRTVNQSYASGPYGRRWGRAGWGGVGWTETVVDEYEEGTLVIDFIDVSKSRLVWRGIGTRRLANNPNPDRVTQRVNEAVGEILAAFPPAP